MNAPSPSPLLRPVLRIFGLIFIFGIFVLNRLWPSGWAWAPEQPAYLQMILAIYITLGVFLDRKSTRLNSSHTVISYAVFCLKKKKKKQESSPPIQYYVQKQY